MEVWLLSVDGEYWLLTSPHLLLVIRRNSIQVSFLEISFMVVELMVQLNFGIFVLAEG